MSEGPISSDSVLDLFFFSQSECSFSMLRNFWGTVRPFFNNAALRVIATHVA